MSTEDKLINLRARWLASEGDRFDRWLNKWTESPVERLFGAALLSNGWRFLTIEEAARTRHKFPLPPRANFQLIARDVAALTLCCPQMTVSLGNGGSFRADFVITSIGASLVVEIDGHDFHERTKQQAARDRSRDRALTLQGISVLRFTGSEVWRDAEACVRQVHALLDKRTANLPGRTK